MSDSIKTYVQMWDEMAFSFDPLDIMFLLQV